MLVNQFATLDVDEHINTRILPIDAHHQAIDKEHCEYGSNPLTPTRFVLLFKHLKPRHDGADLPKECLSHYRHG